ncbi:MFS transporter [Stackebrandtia soli]|uniref:MFS transporter n=1 Tax=Stackebrandtia soli TaxID=1892856 RepID=UPI0039EB948B
MTPTSRARLAVSVAFAVHGVVSASWLPHIPQIKAALDLSEGQLGLVLLAPPAGAILAMPLTGALCARFGSAAVTKVTMPLYAAGFTAVGAGVGAPWTLAAALLLAGALIGSFDVAMNAQAATVERAAGTPIMGSFHAVWSLAAAAGAGIGGLAAQWEVPLFAQLAALGSVGVVAALLFGRFLLPDGPVDASATKRRGWRFERGLLISSLVAFAALLAEGAAADWSALFLQQTQDAGPFVASLGYTIFSIAMFVGRLAGDRLVGRYGRGRSIATAALSGGGGLAVGLAAATVTGPGVAGQTLVISGLLALGLGIAVIVPVVFSAAGDGPGIAMVSTGGYTGWLLGPAVIGGLGEWLGLTSAIWTIPLLAIIAGALAPLGVRSLRGDRDEVREPHVV